MFGRGGCRALCRRTIGSCGIGVGVGSIGVGSIGVGVGSWNLMSRTIHLASLWAGTLITLRQNREARWLGV